MQSESCTIFQLPTFGRFNPPFEEIKHSEEKKTFSHPKLNKQHLEEEEEEEEEGVEEEEGEEEEESSI